MNYKIIGDKNMLINFIDWLPELEDNEKYYLALFARKKYAKEALLSNDKTQLKRFTSNKERLYNKISQLEIPLGRYILKKATAPQDSLALYISINPRCMKKATELMGKKCWDLMNGKNFNLHAEALSCIQKSKSRSCFVDFDIDEKDLDLDLDWLNAKIGKDNYKALETRGGYHLLVEPKKATAFRKKQFDDNKWHQLISKKYPVDQSGDQLLPVSGTFQGGFIPFFRN